MDLKKRVIESTIVAVLLIVVTAVTAVVSPMPVTEVLAKDDSKTVTAEQSDGMAGIIEELTNARISAEESAVVSVEKSDRNTVAEAAEPSLTEEEKAWSNKLMADVEEFLYIRSGADAESEIAGKLYKGAAADITETLDGWYHITSGSVDGYVKSEYCIIGMEALNYARTNCDTVATATTGGLRIRSEASEEADILKAAEEGEQFVVDLEAPAVEGWVAVNMGDTTAYVSAEYVTVALNVAAAVSLEEEQAALAKQAEEEARQQAQVARTQNAAIAASADELTLLAAIIYCEAGHEPYEGQLAVGAVVMNRVRSGSYPGSIYEVIYQGGQFTPAGSGKVASVIASGSINSSSYQAAQEALAGVDNTGGCLSFRQVRSGRSGLIIGNHVFF